MHLLLVVFKGSTIISCHLTICTQRKEERELAQQQMQSCKPAETLSRLFYLITFGWAAALENVWGQRPETARPAQQPLNHQSADMQRRWWGTNYKLIPTSKPSIHDSSWTIMRSQWPDCLTESTNIWKENWINSGEVVKLPVKMIQRSQALITLTLWLSSCWTAGQHFFPRIGAKIPACDLLKIQDLAIIHL